MKGISNRLYGLIIYVLLYKWYEFYVCGRYSNRISKNSNYFIFFNNEFLNVCCVLF